MTRKRGHFRALIDPTSLAWKLKFMMHCLFVYFLYSSSTGFTRSSQQIRYNWQWTACVITDVIGKTTATHEFCHNCQTWKRLFQGRQREWLSSIFQIVSVEFLSLEFGQQAQRRNIHNTATVDDQYWHMHLTIQCLRHITCPVKSSGNEISCSHVWVTVEMF